MTVKPEEQIITNNQQKKVCSLAPYHSETKQRGRRKAGRRSPGGEAKAPGASCPSGAGYSCDIRWMWQTPVIPGRGLIGWTWREGTGRTSGWGADFWATVCQGHEQHLLLIRAPISCCQRGSTRGSSHWTSVCFISLLFGVWASSSHPWHVHIFGHFLGKSGSNRILLRKAPWE